LNLRLEERNCTVKQRPSYGTAGGKDKEMADGFGDY